VLKILFKSAVLVFIILSVYFIVNPAACSNFMLGRVSEPAQPQPAATEPADIKGERLTPAGDQPLAPHALVKPETEDSEFLHAPEPSQEPVYTQEDIDYAIASRYVELENEYAKDKKLGKDAAKDIAYKVMDDFELTQQEWEAFLERATASNLFNKIRKELAGK